MPVSLKYAVVERERRFLVERIPDGVTRVSQITDRYLAPHRIDTQSGSHTGHISHDFAEALPVVALIA